MNPATLADNGPCPTNKPTCGGGLETQGGGGRVAPAVLGAGHET